MFEFAEIEALNYYKKLGDKVIFFFETSWCDDCESFLSKLICIHDELNDIPVYRVGLDIDGGEYIKEKFDIDSTPTLLLFSDGEEERRITDEDRLAELL